MFFTVLVLIDIILLFIPLRKDFIKKIYFLYSILICLFGIYNLSNFVHTSSDMWKNYFENISQTIANQINIQFKGLELLESVSYFYSMAAIVITFAIIILSLVLRRFDGNLNKAVFFIKLLIIIVPIISILLFGFNIIIKIPFFAFVLLLESLNLVSVIVPSLLLFDFMCSYKEF